LGAQSLPRGLDVRFPRRFSDIPAMRLEAFNCANGACSQSNGVHAPGPLGSCVLWLVCAVARVCCGSCVLWLGALWHCCTEYCCTEYCCTDWGCDRAGVN
jgi:hypothetical protein